MNRYYLKILVAFVLAGSFSTCAINAPPDSNLSRDTRLNREERLTLLRRSMREKNIHATDAHFIEAAFIGNRNDVDRALGFLPLVKAHIGRRP